MDCMVRAYFIQADISHRKNQEKGKAWGWCRGSWAQRWVHGKSTNCIEEMRLNTKWWKIIWSSTLPILWSSDAQIRWRKGRRR